MVMQSRVPPGNVIPLTVSVSIWRKRSYLSEFPLASRCCLRRARQISLLGDTTAGVGNLSASIPQGHRCVRTRVRGFRRPQISTKALIHGAPFLTRLRTTFLPSQPLPKFLPRVQGGVSVRGYDWEYNLLSQRRTRWGVDKAGMCNVLNKTNKHFYGNESLQPITASG